LGPLGYSGTFSAGPRLFPYFVLILSSKEDGNACACLVQRSFTVWLKVLTSDTPIVLLLFVVVASQRERRREVWDVGHRWRPASDAAWRTLEKWLRHR